MYRKRLSIWQRKERQIKSEYAFPEFTFLFLFFHNLYSEQKYFKKDQDRIDRNITRHNTWNMIGLEHKTILKKQV